MIKCNFAFTWDSIHYKTVVVGFRFLYLILLSHVSSSIRLPHELGSWQISTFNIQQEHSYFKIKHFLAKFWQILKIYKKRILHFCKFMLTSVPKGTLQEMVKYTSFIPKVWIKRWSKSKHLLFQICDHLLISRKRGAVFRALSLTAPSCGHYLTLQSYKTILVLNSEML